MAIEKVNEIPSFFTFNVKQNFTDQVHVSFHWLTSRCR